MWVKTAVSNSVTLVDQSTQDYTATYQSVCSVYEITHCKKKQENSSKTCGLCLL